MQVLFFLLGLLDSLDLWIVFIFLTVLLYLGEGGPINLIYLVNPP